MSCIYKSSRQYFSYTTFAPFSDHLDYTSLCHYLMFDFILSTSSFSMLPAIGITEFSRTRAMRTVTQWLLTAHIILLCRHDLSYYLFTQEKKNQILKTG